jgi:hypothetical protein
VLSVSLRFFVRRFKTSAAQHVGKLAVLKKSRICREDLELVDEGASTGAGRDTLQRDSVATRSSGPAFLHARPSELKEVSGI